MIKFSFRIVCFRKLDKTKLVDETNELDEAWQQGTGSFQLVVGKTISKDTPKRAVVLIEVVSGKKPYLYQH